MTALHWYDEAACRGLDVELFYTDEPSATSRALQVCRACPVRADCHQTAMRQRESYGVWGGTPEHLRRRIFRREDRARRRQARAA